LLFNFTSEKLSRRTGIDNKNFLIQELAQEFKPRMNACRDADGKILTEKKSIFKEDRKNILKMY
jgi:hypothetical protein